MRDAAAEYEFAMRASMGPRHVGRGNSDTQHYEAYEPLASMGPRHVGRGNIHQLNVECEAYCASMGPRHVGRGNETLLDLLDRCVQASMGPRHVGRGNMVTARSRTGNPAGFNGAASRRTRKLSRGHPVLSGAKELQWGRVT